jgi:hypothetical protein
MVREPLERIPHRRLVSNIEFEHLQTQVLDARKIFHVAAARKPFGRVSSKSWGTDW